jgi:hypothetical protein
MEQPVKGDSPVSEVSVRLQDNPVQKMDTTDRQNTAGVGMTKKNPEARIKDREDEVVNLCGATNNCSSAR